MTISPKLVGVGHRLDIIPVYHAQVEAAFGGCLLRFVPFSAFDVADDF
jgi:hypothetical protein